MPTYKLTYFNGRGRAEVTRYLFAIADVEYEDNRIKREEWPELKKSLSGKDDIQEAIADSYVLAVDDLLKSILQFFLEKDEERKAELKRKFKEETAPNTLSKFEAFLSANSSDYFVGNELTWADVVLFHMMSLLRSRALSDEDLSAFPKMLAFESRIKALPRIASWIAKRPESEF